MTMTSKTFSTTFMAAIFALSFSAAILIGAVGPAVNVSPATSYVA